MRRQIPKKISVKTLDELDDRVYQLILEGFPQNHILQIKFDVNGIEQRLNVSKLSKIKKKFEGIKDKEDDDKDPLSAYLFKKFSEGKNEVEVVIATKLKPEIVEKKYEQYNRLGDKEVVPKWFMDKIRAQCYRLELHYNPDDPCPSSKLDYNSMGMFISSSVDTDIDSYPNS